MIDLELSAEQTRRRTEAVARTGAVPSLRRARELAEHGAPIDDDDLRAAARLGWFALLTDPPGASTTGCGIAEAAVVAEARGATLHPGPIVPMSIVAMSLARSASAGHRTVGGQVVRAETTASWVWADRHGGWAATPTVSAVARDGSWVLNGTGGLVQDGHQVAWLMVRASTAEGERSFLVSTTAHGLTRTRLDSFDLTRSFSTVIFDDVPVEGGVAIDGDDPLVERQLHVAATLAVAETVGAMERLLARTVQYAKDRVAFGRPIGSFQAIKHLLADASVALETSSAMAAAAIRAVDAGRDDAGQIVSMAKAFVGDAALEVANACWQTHGGIAYTWEHDFHLYLRRLTTDASLYGDPTFHRERLCRLNGLGVR